MLTIARTLMGNPGCILLDEPSGGLAPVVVEQIITVVQEIKAQGIPVLLSEQNLHFAALVSDRAYVIETGRIRYEGAMAELECNAEVRQQYLTASMLLNRSQSLRRILRDGPYGQPTEEVRVWRSEESRVGNGGLRKVRP